MPPDARVPGQVGQLPSQPLTEGKVTMKAFLLPSAPCCALWTGVCVSPQCTGCSLTPQCNAVGGGACGRC